MTGLFSFWYHWGVFVGVFLAAAAAIYIFFDSQQAVAAGRTTWPRILSVVGLLLTLPSLYYRLTQMDAADVLADFFEADNNFSLFFFLALAGVLLALVALIYYFMIVRLEDMRYPSVYMEVEPPPLPASPSQMVVDLGSINGNTMVAGGDVIRPTTSLRRATEVFRQGPIAFLIDTQTGRQFTLTDGTTIGSAADNDVILDEPTVSGKHAKLKIEGDEFALFDLASTNGTTINGKSIMHHVLVDGDEVQIGRKSLTFKSIGELSQPNRRDTEALDIKKDEVRSMRLDAAVPDEVVIGQSFELAVALKQILSSQLNVQGLDKVRSEELKVKFPTGATTVQPQVHVLAPDCHIIGPSSQRFDLYDRSDSPILYFSLVPMRVGEIFIRVTVTQSFLVLGSARLGITTRECLAGAVTTSVKSLPIDQAADDPFSTLLPDLYHFIDANFSLHEVKEICFEMGIDYDDLRGGLKSEKIMELILFCRHRERHEELIERVIQARPNWYEQILQL